MPSLQLSNLFRGPLSKMSMVTSLPLSLLLLGLQAMIDVKFSCPCKLHYNQGIAFLICFAPAIVALVIMLFLLRPFKYKCEYEWTKKICCFSEKQNNRGTSQEECNRGTSQGDNRGTSQVEDNRVASQGEDNRVASQGEDNRGISQGDNRGTSQGEDNRVASQGEDNRGTSQGEDNRGTSQREDNRGTSQREDNRGTSQGEDKKETSQSERNELEENLRCEKTFLACLIPSLVWLCLWFIDGDYFACGTTYWDGHYTCDKELHQNCLNWCKPNELSQGKTETAYGDTRKWIRISKIVGYSLAIFFSLIAIYFARLDYRKSGKTDPESQIHGRQDPGTENQQRNNNPQIGNIENPTEDDRLIMTSF